MSTPLDLAALATVDVAHSDLEASSAQVRHPSGRLSLFSEKSSLFRIRTYSRLSTLQSAASHAMLQHRFTAYHSPLSSYPLLRLHSRYPVYSEARPSSLDSTTATANRYTQLGVSGILPALDLKILQDRATNNWLSDPAGRLCKYEVPGGGECRDSECADIHPSRARAVEPSGTSVRPSSRCRLPLHVLPLDPLAPRRRHLRRLLATDLDTARFIHEALPASSHLTVNQLQAALEDVRQRKPTASLEARVSEALGSFGYQMASEDA